MAIKPLSAFDIHPYGILDIGCDRSKTKIIFHAIAEERISSIVAVSHTLVIRETGMVRRATILSFHPLMSHELFALEVPLPSAHSSDQWPLLLHGLTSIPAWISNHIPCKVWGEITYPFLNLV